LLVVGNNGEGKTNLLEAVELLGSLRSHRCSQDRDLIQRGAGSSVLRAGVEGPGGANDLLALELRRQGGRQVLRNGHRLERHSDLMATIRCVVFSTLDLSLIRGEPSLRRQWLDRVVVQLEPVYGELLSRFGRLLRQRAELLRQSGGSDNGLLDVFDEHLAAVGARIHRRRRRALERLTPLAEPWLQHLSGGRDRLGLAYAPGTEVEAAIDDSQWQEGLLLQLRRQRPLDRRLGSTSVGPHRDDLRLLLDDEPVRQLGSAGQQRCVVLALKLAELELVEQVSRLTPLLLLDDVLAELDPERQARLLAAIGDRHQCLVTTTHLLGCGDDWRRSAQVVEVRGGELTALQEP
jgi:DNA replication and repair protein RecF